MRRALVLVVLGACGRFDFDARSAPGDSGIFDGDASVPAFVATWTSGPRLRARLLIGGGDPIFYGWHDSQLNTDCQAAIATDGQERCMPYRSRADQFFMDAACTQPLGLVYGASCGHDSYAFTDTGQVHEFPLGALYTGNAYYKAGASCTVQAPPPNTELHMLGAEEPPTSFVTSNYQQQLVGSFRHSINVFGDGATHDIGIVTTATGSCEPIATGLGPSQCRATTRQAQLAYSDGACTQPALFWPRTSYDPPSVSQLIVLAPDACNTAYTLYDTGTDVTGPKYYEKTATGCASFTTPANGVLYTASVAANPYPMGTILRGPDRGRIGTLYWHGPDNVDIPVGHFDQMLGDRCTPMNGTDGVLRCLPEAGDAVAVTGDSACTSTVAEMYAQCFGTEPVDGPNYTSCVDSYAVHPYNRIVTAAWEEQDGTCTALSLPGGDAREPLVGAELPPSMFPALTEMVE